MDNAKLDAKALVAKYEPKEIKVLSPERQMFTTRISPCGKFILGAGYDARVHRWDLEQEDVPQLSALEGHHGWVTSLAFAGDLLFTSDSWGALRAWRYAEESPEPLWQHEAAHDGWLRQLAVSPDGKLLATCGADRVVRVWSTADGEKQAELTGHAHDVFSVAFHPGGKSLVSGDLLGVVNVWELESGKCERSLDAGALHLESRLQNVGGVRVLAFTADGEMLLCAGTTPKNGGNVNGTPTILRFEFGSGKLHDQIQLGASSDALIYDVHQHADGFLMVVTSAQPGNGKLFFHRPGDDEPFFIYTKMANCHSLSMHPDGKRFIASSTNKGSGGNGRKTGEYKSNHSPIHIFEFPSAETPDPAA